MLVRTGFESLVDRSKWNSAGRILTFPRSPRHFSPHAGKIKVIANSGTAAGASTTKVTTAQSPPPRMSSSATPATPDFSSPPLKRSKIVLLGDQSVGKTSLITRSVQTRPTFGATVASLLLGHMLSFSVLWTGLCTTPLTTRTRPR